LGATAPEAELPAGRAAAGFATLPAMVSSLEERLVLLAAVALIGGVVAVAVGDRRAEDASSAAFTSAPAPGGWNRAFAGSRGPVGDAQRTTCGQYLTQRSLGVTHPVLPCGARIVLRNGDTQILTEVIDHALVEPGRELEVTERLARMLGLGGELGELEWRFAADANS
jgi:hypothetical protein